MSKNANVLHLLELLDRPIAFHRCFMTITGKITAAVMLSQALYWSKPGRNKDPDGWFFKTQVEWEEETGLTRREQETARKAMKGILETKLRGLPGKLYYRVNIEVLLARLAENAKLLKTNTGDSIPSLAENAKVLSRKTHISHGGKRTSINKETTEETTEEITLSLSPTPQPSDGVCAPSRIAGERERSEPSSQSEKPEPLPGSPTSQNSFPPAGPGDPPELARQLWLTHPKNSHLRLEEVHANDVHLLLTIIRGEAIAAKTDQTDAALTMIGLVADIAAAVRGTEQEKFLPAPEKFFRERRYRQAPQQFTRNVNGGKLNELSIAERYNRAKNLLMAD